MDAIRVASLGYNQVSSPSTAQPLGKGLTNDAVPAGANAVLISVETAGIRWRDDGVDPTASVGMPIAAAAAPFFYAGNLAAFRFISQTGSPVVDITFYKIVG